MARTVAYSVRAGVLDDATSLAEIHVVTWKAAYARLFPAGALDHLTVAERTPSWRDRLAIGHGPDYFVLVAQPVGAGSIVGFATGGGTRDDDRKGGGEVYALYVHPDHWRDGAGTLLLCEALRHLRDSSFSDATLWTLEQNMSARAFYERNGWRADGSRRTFTYERHSLYEIRYEHATI